MVIGIQLLSNKAGKQRTLKERWQNGKRKQLTEGEPSRVEAMQGETIPPPPRNLQEDEQSNGA